MTELKPCDNELCDRLTSSRAAYCCGGCAAADKGRYEIHEAGPLGHTQDCHQRHAERSSEGWWPEGETRPAHISLRMNYTQAVGMGLVLPPALRGARALRDQRVIEQRLPPSYPVSRD